MRIKHRLDPSGLLIDRVERALRARIATLLANGERAPMQERELAAEYGVSHKTVRTALARIKQDNLVRSVPGKGTFVVAAAERRGRTLLLCRSLQHPFHAMAVECCLAALRSHGQPPAMTVVSGTVTEPSDDWLLDSFSSIIVIGDIGRPLVQALAARARVPLIMLGDFFEAVRLPPICDQIVPDTRAGAFMATRHLLAAGHRRILLAGWMNNTVWGREMRRGYEEALEVAGVAPDTQLVLDLPEVHFEASSTGAPRYIEDLGAMKRRLETLLASSRAPTALIHNSAVELQYREMAHTYFHDHFADDAVMGINFRENLVGGFHGVGRAWSAAIPFRLLTEQARLQMEASRQERQRPLRMLLDQYRVVRRVKQEWTDWPEPQ